MELFDIGARVKYRHPFLTNKNLIYVKGWRSICNLAQSAMLEERKAVEQHHAKYNIYKEREEEEQSCRVVYGRRAPTAIPVRQKW